MMVDEDKKTLAESINEDLANTFNEMTKEIATVNKEEEEKNAASREKEVEEETNKEIEKEEEKTLDKPTEEEEPKLSEKEVEEGEEEEPGKELSLEPGDLEPNSGWDKEIQDGFKQLPENMQEFMLKRHHEMQADYTRKTKEVADIKRALDPARELIDKLGISEGEAVKNLVGAHMLLQTKPLVGIQYLMQAYNVSLDDVTNNWQDDETFTQTVAENSRMSRAESELDAKKREMLEANAEQAMKEITEFKKDHSHYDKVEKHMIRLAKLALVNGEPKPSLESLYEQAVRLDPEVSDLLNSKEKPKSGNDVKKAKKASTRIKGTPKKEEKKPTKPATIHDELSQEWDKVAGA